MTSSLAPTVTLPHGAVMPMLGLGTWPMRGAEGAAAVRTAIEVGYRLIDTAENYRNEDAVGQGWRDSGLDRSEVFITTKFNRQWHSVDGVREAWRASTRRLGTDYIDMFMVHWPNPDQDQYVEALRGLGRLLADGSIRAIGTSNFTPAHLRRVLDEAGLTPDVNQIQLSPYQIRRKSRHFHQEHGIVTQSWSPIGGSEDDLRSDPVIVQIAQQHGKSPTQTVLRWHYQCGLASIPKSANPERIAENMAVFDFAMTEDEVAAISKLDRGEATVTDSDVFGH